jgi:hypothetical protein
MTTRMHRTQILLDPKQHRALSDLARQEGRSVSEIVREFVQVQLEQRQQDDAARQQRQLTALEQIRAQRREIAARLGATELPAPEELIHQLREERDADLTPDSDRY